MPDFHLIRDILAAVAFTITSLVAAWAIFRIPRIVKALDKFIEARADIRDLRSAIFELSKLNIKDDMVSLTELLQAQIKQINELQRMAADEPQAAPQQAQAAATVTQDSSTSDNNFELIRDHWSRTRDKIESIVESITDGRTRRKYNTLARYDYTEIIKKLKDDGMITTKAAAAANMMNKAYLSLRGRKRPITQANVDLFAGSASDFENELGQRAAAA